MERKELKKKLKNILIKKTKCQIQHTGWPCGTCFYSVSEKLNNKDWQTVLLIRGDYTRKILNNIPEEKNVNNRLKRIYRIYNDKPSNNVSPSYPIGSMIEPYDIWRDNK